MLTGNFFFLPNSYFGLFDSDERVNLGYVYKPDAVFSCTVALPEESLNRLQQQLNGGQRNQNDTALQRSVWSEYLARSRNFETVKEPCKYCLFLSEVVWWLAFRSWYQPHTFLRCSISGNEAVYGQRGDRSSSPAKLPQDRS